MARGFGGEWFDVSGSFGLRSCRRKHAKKHRCGLEKLEQRVVLNAAPLTKEDFVLAAAGQPVLVDYLALNDVDPDGDTLTVTSVAPAAHGTLSDNGDGTWTYLPMIGYVGADSFTYVVSDGHGKTAGGQVTVSVNEVLDPESVRTALLAGVSALSDPVQPSYTIAYGPTAVSVSKYVGTQNSMVSASSWGSGKVVALPDHQWLNMTSNAGQADTGRFYLNSIEWLAESSSRDVKIVVFDSEKQSWLEGQGYTDVVVSNWMNLNSDLANADVFIPGWMGSDASEANLKTIADFTRSGGGLFIADYGPGYNFWWGKSYDQAPGNLLLREAGIGFTRYYLGSSANFPVERTMATVNAQSVFDMIENPESYAESEVLHLQDLVFHMRYVLPPDDSFLLDVTNKMSEASLQIYATPETPVTSPFEKMLLRQEMQSIQDLPAREVTAHRTAEALFGAIDPNATRMVDRVVTVDGNISGWVATGTYAAPGELITITVPSELVGKGYNIRINGHFDNISNRDSWSRVPFGVSRNFPIDSDTMEVANAFGGHIYIDFGGGAEGGSPGLGFVNVTIDGAIDAPIFTLGRTTNFGWNHSFRNHPAPYAELVSDNLAMSVPSAWIRDLEDPTALMAYWNEVVAVQDWVGGLETIRSGPERINYDVQISLGLLHSGYPTQAPVSYGSKIVDLEALMADGDWGWFQELGHEMQRSSELGWGNDNPYTFPGDVEVTVNIFANAALEHMTTNPSTDGWGWSAHRGEVMRRAKAAIDGSQPRNFEDKDVYPFYFQLADGPWGWQAYRDVLSTYVQDAMYNPDRLPSDVQEEKDEWLIRWSAATGYNMTPFMVDYWGLEVSDEAIAIVDSMNFPPWTPLAVSVPQIQVTPGGSYTIDMLGIGESLDSTLKLIHVGSVSNGTLTPEGAGVYTYEPVEGAESDSLTVTYESGAGNRQTFTIDIDISSGGVLMERFEYINGRSIADLRSSPNYPGNPANIEVVDKFEAPTDAADNYGLRMRAYLTAPETGEYTFWIASDDNGELWLSSDDNPINASKIADVSDWTFSRQWTKFASQKSATISLVAGEKYYIEALMKEGNGGDNLAVAWSGPGIDGPTVIDGEFLTVVPYRSPDAPIAKNDTVEVIASGGAFDVLTNDSDPDPEEDLSVVAVGQAKHGIVTINPDGAIHYSPNTGYVGPDTFAYMVTNSQGLTDTAWVTVQTKGLVSYWSMNDGSGSVAADDGGVSSDGTLNGPSWTASPHGGALSFDGVDDTVAIGTAGALSGMTDFTIGAWIRTTSGGVIIQQRDTSFNGEYRFQVTPQGTLELLVYGDNAYQYELRTTATVNEGNWHYVVAQREARIGKIYVDGVTAAVGRGPVRNLSPYIGTHIGGDILDRDKYFQGEIDEVRIYNYALTEQEVNVLPELESATMRAVIGKANVQASDQVGGHGFLDIRLLIPPGTAKAISGYSMIAQVDPSLGISLTSANEAPGALFPGRMPTYSGTSTSLLVSDQLSDPNSWAAVTDGSRLFRLEFDIPAGIEGSFDVRLLNIVLIDDEGNSIQLEDLSVESITVRQEGAPIASQIILRPLEDLRTVGTSDASVVPAPHVFHEWQDVGGELWINIDDDLPDGLVDLNIEFSFTASALLQEMDLVGVDGSFFLGNETEQDGRAIRSLLFRQLDLSSYEPGTRVLIATMKFAADNNNPAGLSAGSAVEANGLHDLGFRLDRIEVDTWSRAVNVIPDIPGEMAPVVYDSDDDGRVGLSDFSDFVAAFGSRTDERPEFALFDYDLNGRISLTDFSLFVQHFGYRKPRSGDIQMPGLTQPTVSSPQLSILEGEPVFVWHQADDRVMGTEPSKASTEAKPGDSLDATVAWEVPQFDYSEPVDCTIDPVLLEHVARDREAWCLSFEEVEVIDFVFGKPLEDDALKSP